MQRARFNRFFQLAAGVLACSAGFATAETIRLGGPRDIVVDIDDVQGGFSVVVEMRPVACFDKATNARINRSKACLYGLAGVEKSLAIETGRLAALRNVIGMNVEEVTPAADRYRLRFFVPETELHREDAPVSATELGHAADGSSLQASPRSELFTCVRDYEMTFEELKRSFCERVHDAAGAASKAASRDTIAEFAGEARRTLAVIDSDAKRAFTAAEKDFTDDLRVLTMEKESLSKSLASAAADFEAAKAAAYSALESLEIRIQEQPAPTSPAKEAIESASPK